jgi:RNA polymerase sigma-70 factor, ECF subfamily
MNEVFPDGERPQDEFESPWIDVVARIRAGDSGGLEDLYRVFATGVRFQLQRQLGEQDLDDRVHDLFLMIARSIRDGEVRDPARLMGYVRTVVRRQVAEFIKEAIRARRSETRTEDEMPVFGPEPDPEMRVIQRQKVQLAMRVLNGVASRDREVLVRFYFQEQPVDEICRGMGLSETQFRLIKSRAKLRFEELCRSRFSLKKPGRR